MNTCVTCSKRFPKRPGRGRQKVTCSDECARALRAAQKLARGVPPCTQPECENPARSGKHPLCEMHYGRMRRYGALEAGECAYCGEPRGSRRSIYCSRRCSLRMNRARAYGMTAIEAIALERSRNGKCDICDTVVVDRRGLHWDHDHETGRLRGLLCKHCNLAIGQFRDDPSLLRKAADYLDGGET